MAAIGQGNEDPYCRYTSFRLKPGGNVPCLALGWNDVGAKVSKEIIGLAFQKVDTGVVRPVLSQDRFSRVHWANAPNWAYAATGVQAGEYIDLDIPPPAHIPPLWEEFATLMSHTRQAMLAQMTTPGGQEPESLFEGIAMNVWNGGFNNKYRPTGNGQRTRAVQIKLGAHWSNNTIFQKWVSSVVNGLHGAHTLQHLFTTLFPECEVFNEQELVVPPAETSINATIRDGVPHCLVYGYHEEQLRGRPATRNQSAVNDGTNLSKRVVLPREMGSRPRSRSPSPVRDDEDPDDLVDEVINTARPNAKPTLSDMFDNPDDYLLYNHAHHRYFEPRHKPDLALISSSLARNNLEDEAVIAKIVFKVSPSYRFKSCMLDMAVLNTTEELVQSCLAAFASNQDIMHGLVVVVDGLKLVKIEKQIDGNNTVSYVVSETRLVQWNHVQQMYVLFNMIQNCL